MVLREAFRGLACVVGGTVLLGCGKPAPSAPPVIVPPPEQAVPAAGASSPELAVPVPSPVVTPPAARAADHPGAPLNPGEVKAAIEKYFNQFGSAPRSWQDMIGKRLIPGVPPAKNGKPLDFAEYEDYSRKSR